MCIFGVGIRHRGVAILEAPLFQSFQFCLCAASAWTHTQKSFWKSYVSTERGGGRYVFDDVDVLFGERACMGARQPRAHNLRQTPDRQILLHTSILA